MNGTSGEELRRNCHELLAGLGVLVTSEARRQTERASASDPRYLLTPPFRMAEFCQAMSVKRNRPIVIRQVTAGGEGHACGLWVATDATDVILVERAATPEHQDHIIAHELGHMAFDHYGTIDASPSFLAEWLPNVSQGLVERVLGRNAYTAREELEAEVFASVLMTIAAGPARRTEGVNRFASALEPDGLWHG